MNKPELAAFFNSLSKNKRADFLKNTGITEAYLRQLISTGKMPSAKTCVKIERATLGKVTRQMLRPDWREIWDYSSEQKITSGYYLKKKPGFSMLLLLKIFGY